MSWWAVAFSESIDPHSCLLISPQQEHIIGVTIPIFISPGIFSYFWHFFWWFPSFTANNVLAHGIFLHFSPVVFFFLSIFMIVFYSFWGVSITVCFLTKTNKQTKYYLKYRIECLGSFPALKHSFCGFFWGNLIAGRYFSAKSPLLMSDFQELSASTSSSFISYDQTVPVEPSIFESSAFRSAV